PLRPGRIFPEELDRPDLVPRLVPRLELRLDRRRRGSATQAAPARARTGSRLPRPRLPLRDAPRLPEGDPRAEQRSEVGLARALPARGRGARAARKRRMTDVQPKTEGSLS